MLKPKPSEPPVVALSAAIYRLLLVFYPASFRREYGAHMMQVFRDCCLSTFAGLGTQGMVDLWGRTLFDWLKSVIAEQLNRETDMTVEKYIRLSGWAMMLGAVSLVFGFMVDANRIRALIYRVVGAPTRLPEYERIRSIAESIGPGIMLLGMLLILFGTLGLRTRFGRQSGRKGYFWLSTSLLAGAGAVLGVLGLVGDFSYFVIWMGISLQYIALGLFGLSARRKRVLPKWELLPVILGGPIPVFLAVVVVFEPLIATSMAPFFEAAGFSVAICEFAGLFMLGYLLHSDPQLPEIMLPSGKLRTNN